MEKLQFGVSILNESDLNPKYKFLETLSNLKGCTDVTLEMATEIFYNIRKNSGYIFVARLENGEIVGTTTTILEQKFYHNGKFVCHIEDVATRKGFEGHGIAKALLEKVFEFAKEKNCYKIILDCSLEVMPYYLKNGFYEFGKNMRIDL